MATAHAIMNAKSSARKVTILVVEDEVLVRAVLAEDLRDQGYAIIEAANADEALSILQSNTDIELVITDKRVPGSLDGLALARLIRRDRSRVAVIMISGEALDGEMPEVLHAYLRKPCRMTALLSHVRALGPTKDG